MTNGRPGQRERRKAATREALGRAALRLAAERGAENVRVRDIAAEAGVSPRTFNNYFSSKAEAIVYRHRARLGEAAEALRGRPAGEPLWEALTRALLAPYEDAGGQPAPRWTPADRRVLHEPALQAELLRDGVDAAAGLAAAVAARTGTDPERDLYPKLVAGAALAAVRAAADQHLAADPPVPFPPLLAEALRQLAAGLPDPARR
ncbi:TetR family transcriptional regulator [Kitasatospora sp. NPDC018619]|uniref:acyl-CoA-like ligand-binding transcription factor n=1 Tax=unclassified Kitasatospora TaxID=2633591 RepID=UPI00378BA2AC